MRREQYDDYRSMAEDFTKKELALAGGCYKLCFQGNPPGHWLKHIVWIFIFKKEDNYGDGWRKIATIECVDRSFENSFLKKGTDIEFGYLRHFYEGFTSRKTKEEFFEDMIHEPPVFEWLIWNHIV